MSDELRHQVLQRVEGWQRAGVEFLPRASLPLAVTTLPTVEDTEAVSPSGAGADRKDIRNQELAAVATKVAACKLCPELAATRTQTVFGVGSLDPELCFVGEAPGADEDRQGVPFVGAAGQLLDRIIAAMGLNRDDLYICNILRCRPPGNRTPKADEAEHCRGFLERTLELVRPRFLCALGLTAAQNLLNSRSSLGKLRGRFHDYKGIPVVCTYHPAALLPSRSPEKKKDVWDDMKMLLAKMGRPVPAAGKKDA